MLEIAGGALIAGPNLRINYNLRTDLQRNQEVTTKVMT